MSLRTVHPLPARRAVRTHNRYQDPGSRTRSPSV